MSETPFVADPHEPEEESSLTSAEPDENPTAPTETLSAAAPKPDHASVEALFAALAAPLPTKMPDPIEPASHTGAHETESITGESGTGTAHYSAKQTRRARDILTRLYAVRRAARFYPLEHPAVMEGVVLLSESLVPFFSEGVDVEFAFFEGEIMFGDQLLTEESVLFDQLIRELTSTGVGSLVFRRGADEQELARAVLILAFDAAEVAKSGGIEHMVVEADLPHVQIGAVRMLERVRKPEGEPSEEARVAFSSAVSLMREIDRLLRANRHVSTMKVKGVVRSLVDNVLANRYAMLQLTGLKNYDEYTFYHSANVAILSLVLGSSVTNDYRFLSSLGVGALLHDIGKLTVDLQILNKPGALSPEEWANVRQHPITGAEMTALLPGVDKSAVVTILEHHMRWDGTGYPSRTPRRKQHLASRIVAVADSYDAMTSQRSYSAARVQDDAMATLAKSAGASLDPTLVRLFVQLMGLYPPRSIVRLSNDEIAIVLAPGEGDPLRPTVRVISSASGEMVTPTDIELIHRPELTVKGCIDPRLINIEIDDYV